ncbi:hypothetical protein IEN85_24075 [Pelagicoccus sp. NFK12]|uniref:Uncharacterized protein n=1 Tax=Pelagicoccus enzymogenes TaxID=2773457 RepID=A0A927IJR4_9BACT|nr:hypothetical protein [Pelagicoccus enzymogenes]MBD5782596.1 hypothetical protein [Pelagicoccus enzymogenes]MDQ8199491.1 hypothetical protein [Pelagicoccus enzymogenes]
MNQASTTQSQTGTPLVDPQESPAKVAPNEQLAGSADLALIVLGVLLLGVSSYMFLLKLCKSLATSGNK